jgi:plastocyanin
MEVSQMQVRPIFVFVGVVLVALATACNGPAAAAPQAKSQSQTLTVSMNEAPYRYTPATLTVPTGATVTWTNAGAEPHTVTADPSKAVNAADVMLPAGAAPWDSGLLTSGQSYSHTFTTAGTYKYFCIPHESLGMVATITVT